MKKKNTFLRTKDEIIESYYQYLLETGIIEDSEREYYESKEGKEDILEALEEVLHDTETYRGQLISTNKAFYHWCTFVMHRDIESGKLIWDSRKKLLKELFFNFERHKYSCTLCQRGGGKSFFVYTLYALFKMYLVEYTSIVAASNVPKMGVRNVRIAKRFIDENELLYGKKNIEKGRELKWSESEYEFNKGMFEITSLGSTPRSAHINFLFVDDILRDDNMYTDDEVENYILGVLLPIAQVKKARMCITGTPIHPKDIYHNLMNSEKGFKGKFITVGEVGHNGFWSSAYPAITDWSKKELLLPEVFTWRSLISAPDSVRNVQGERKFNREYMLICVDEEETLFPTNLVESCCTGPDFIYAGRPGKQYIISCDVATSGAASADYSVFTVIEMGECEDGVLKDIVHITRVKGMEIAEQISTIQKLANEFGNAHVVVEKNNVGVALIQELENKRVDVEPFVTDKFKKEGMIRYLVNEMKNRRIRFPKNDEIPEVHALKYELSNFSVRRVRGKEVMGGSGAHDDTIISLAIGVNSSQGYNCLSSAVLIKTRERR